MAVTLYKLVMSAVTETHTHPEISRFFYLLDPDDVAAGVLTVPAASFADDAGDPASALVLAAEDDGFYQLYVNGTLQQPGLYTVTEENVTVNQAEDIPDNAPIILVVTNFAPTSDTTVTS